MQAKYADFRISAMINLQMVLTKSTGSEKPPKVQNFGVQVFQTLHHFMKNKSVNIGEFIPRHSSMLSFTPVNTSL